MIRLRLFEWLQPADPPAADSHCRARALVTRCLSSRTVHRQSDKSFTSELTARLSRARGRGERRRGKRVREERAQSAAAAHPPSAAAATTLTGWSE